MFEHLIFIVAFSTCIVNTIEDNFMVLDEDSRNIAKNKQDLIEIIQSLNQIDEDSKSNDGDYNTIDGIDTKELNDEDKEKKLQEILWLLKKNLKAKKQHESSHAHGTRLYFIKNPEVIAEYKNYLKQKKRHPFVITEVSGAIGKQKEKETIKNKLQKLRRNIMFRQTQGTNEQSDIDNLDRKDTIIDDYNQQSKQDAFQPIKSFKRKIPLDSLELHNVKVHKKNTINDKHFIREKTIRRDKSVQANNDDIEVKKWNPKRADSIQSERSIEKYNRKEINRNFITKGDWNTLTTKNWASNNNKKKEMPYEYKPKIIYRNPKTDKIKDEFFLYGRTSIPYVGKKGIYEED